MAVQRGGSFLTAQDRVIGFHFDGLSPLHELNSAPQEAETSALCGKWPLIRVPLTLLSTCLTLRPSELRRLA